MNQVWLEIKERLVAGISTATSLSSGAFVAAHELLWLGGIVAYGYVLAEQLAGAKPAGEGFVHVERKLDVYAVPPADGREYLRAQFWPWDVETADHFRVAAALKPLARLFISAGEQPAVSCKPPAACSTIIENFAKVGVSLFGD